MTQKVGSIEAGGTKFVCAVGDSSFNILKTVQIKTTTPAETLEQVVKFFEENPVDALSIGSFGPIEIRENHAKYGYITSTPKPHWQDTDVLGFLKKHLSMPMVWTTDVNSSAYGEKVLAKEPVRSLVYFTIGTGIGGGAIQNDVFIGGASHLEMGHVFVKRHADDLDFEGVCPYHKDCLEGVASGPSIEARTGIKGEVLAQTQPEHKVWDVLSFYIAQAALSATLNIAPEKIVFGGSVMSVSLLEKVKKEFIRQLNGYVAIDDVHRYLVLPAITGNASATIGNFAQALEKIKKTR